MHSAAKMLGKTEDADRYAALKRDVRSEFRLQFVDAQDDRVIRVANGSQTAQAMALMAGMFDGSEIEMAMLTLTRDIEKRGWATTAGDVGHPYVLAALTKYGRSDIVGKMFSDTEKPGYGFQLKHGATSLTESWDGPARNAGSGSQNHLMLGSGEEWFFAGLAGFSGMRADLPPDQILVKPNFIDEVDEVSAWTLHPCGRVTIHWRKRGKTAAVKLTVPPGLDALFVSSIDGAQTLLGSGEHVFDVQLAAGTAQ
jgi:hypothetical protein